MNNPTLLCRALRIGKNYKYEVNTCEEKHLLQGMPWINNMKYDVNKIKFLHEGMSILLT